jgi:hypothetical protein
LNMFQELQILFIIIIIIIIITRKILSA